MVFKVIVLVMLVPLACVFLTGCAEKEESADTATADVESTAEVESTVDKAADEVVSSFNEVKDTYVGTVKVAVKEWNEKIDKLVGTKDALPAAAQTPFEEPMKKLLSSRDDVSEKLSAVENSTEDNFEAKRSELDSALGDLSGTYEKVAALF